MSDDEFGKLYKEIDNVKNDSVSTADYDAILNEISKKINVASPYFLTSAQAWKLIQLLWSKRPVLFASYVSLLSALSVDAFNNDSSKTIRENRSTYSMCIRPRQRLPDTDNDNYFGLDWEKTYTYLEARPLIIKKLFSKRVLLSLKIGSSMG